MRDQGRSAGLRVLRALNPSPLTLDGTRTFLVGRERVAIIDPGPALPEHLEAVAGEVTGARAVVLLTHDHPDHAEAAEPLARRIGAPVLAVAARTLADGDRIPTDAGDLIAVATPGHTPDHIVFHWPAARAAFCGDLMMGGQNTALVAPPEGNLTDYLASLEAVRRLECDILYPAHGEPFADPSSIIDAYVRHRREREEQVLSALRSGVRRRQTLVDAVYGRELDSELGAAAAGAVQAYLQHLEAEGRVRRIGPEAWEASEPEAGEASETDHVSEAD